MINTLRGSSELIIPKTANKTKPNPKCDPKAKPMFRLIYLRLTKGAYPVYKMRIGPICGVHNFWTETSNHSISILVKF